MMKLQSTRFEVLSGRVLSCALGRKPYRCVWLTGVVVVDVVHVLGFIRFYWTGRPSLRQSWQLDSKRGNRIKTRSLPQTLTLSIYSKEHGYRSKISNRIARKVPEQPEGLDSERVLQYYVGRTETSVDSNRKENKAWMNTTYYRSKCHSLLFVRLSISILLLQLLSVIDWLITPPELC